MSILYKRIVTALIASLILTGCSPWGEWKKDISDCDTLADSIGENHKLHRNVFIIKQKSLGYAHMVETTDEYYAKKFEELKRNKNYKFAKILGVGTNIKLEKYNVERIYAGPIIIVALGQYYSIDDGRYLDFEYIWSSTSELPRAPWEDDSAADIRTLKLTNDYRCPK